MTFNIQKWRHPEKKEIQIAGALAIFVCPLCGNEWIIPKRTHSISGNGVVKPSAVCPLKGCNFHEFIILDGWKRREVEE